MAVDCRARLQTSPAELEVGSAVHLLAEFTKNTVRAAGRLELLISHSPKIFSCSSS